MTLRKAIVETLERQPARTCGLGELLTHHVLRYLPVDAHGRTRELFRKRLSGEVEALKEAGVLERCFEGRALVVRLTSDYAEKFGSLCVAPAAEEEPGAAAMRHGAPNARDNPGGVGKGPQPTGLPTPAELNAAIVDVMENSDARVCSYRLVAEQVMRRFVGRVATQRRQVLLKSIDTSLLALELSKVIERLAPPSAGYRLCPGYADLFEAAQQRAGASSRSNEQYRRLVVGDQRPEDGLRSEPVDSGEDDAHVRPARVADPRDTALVGASPSGRRKLPPVADPVGEEDQADEALPTDEPEWESQNLDDDVVRRLGVVDGEDEDVVEEDLAPRGAAYATQMVPAHAVLSAIEQALADCPWITTARGIGEVQLKVERPEGGGHIAARVRHLPERHTVQVEATLPFLESACRDLLRLSGGSEYTSITGIALRDGRPAFVIQREVSLHNHAPDEVANIVVKVMSDSLEAARVLERAKQSE